MRRFDRKLVVWQSVFTLVLILWSLVFFIPSDTNELGSEPGYWILFFGVLPSLALLILAFKRPMIAYKAAMLYGAFVAVSSLIIAVISYGFLWIVVFFPIIGFILEGLYIYWRWQVLRNTEF